MSWLRQLVMYIEVKYETHKSVDFIYFLQLSKNDFSLCRIVKISSLKISQNIINFFEIILNFLDRIKVLEIILAHFVNPYHLYFIHNYTFTFTFVNND